MWLLERHSVPLVSMQLVVPAGAAHDPDGKGGLAATTACVRWMVARPPDYRMPLVSSPAGAVPPALVGALFRGLDVILLTTGPLLLVPTENGALVSLLVGGLTLSVLLSRRP